MQKNEIILDEIILERILDLGSRMLKCGGEVRRVEDTVRRICEAYGARRADVFTITTSIVVTVRFEDREPLTQTRRVSSQGFDLRTLDSLNDLSRHLCAHPVSADEIEEKLENIKKVKEPIILSVFAWALVSASYCTFFGGSVWDALCSSLIGIILFFVKSACTKFLVNNYFSIIMCSILGGLLGMIPVRLGLEISTFHVNIGNIMLLISGIGLTTAIRDMFSGDTISGLLRFSESVLVGTAIAWGFAVFNPSGVATQTTQLPWIQIITAFTGSIGYMIIFKAKFKSGLICAIIGAVGWGMVTMLSDVGQSEFIGYFIAVVFITLFAEIMAKVFHSPTTVFLIIGTLPLIPGKSLYVTMQYAINIVTKNSFQIQWEGFVEHLLATLLYAIAIAGGIIFVTTIWDAVFNSIRAKKRMTRK